MPGLCCSSAHTDPPPRCKLYLLQTLQNFGHVLLLASVWLEREIHGHTVQGYLGHGGLFSGGHRGWLKCRLCGSVRRNVLCTSQGLSRSR